MRRKPAFGFTMVELMVTIAIAAILLTIGLPSFRNTLRSNRVATATNELMASLALARTEAIRSPGGGAICTSADGTMCDGTSWNDGWMVWIDANPTDGNPHPTGDDDRIVRYVQGREELDIAAVAAGGTEEANNIHFDRRGRTSELRTLAIEPEDCPEGAELLRTVSIGVTGQVKVDRRACE